MIKLKDVLYGIYIAIQFTVLLCLLAFVAAVAIPIVIFCILFSYSQSKCMPQVPT